MFRPLKDHHQGVYKQEISIQLIMLQMCKYRVKTQYYQLELLICFVQDIPLCYRNENNNKRICFQSDTATFIIKLIWQHISVIRPSGHHYIKFYNGYV